MYINISSNGREASFKVYDTSLIQIIEDLKPFIPIDKWDYSTESVYKLKPNLLEFLKFLVNLGEMEKINSNITVQGIVEEDIVTRICEVYDLLRYNYKYLKEYRNKNSLNIDEAIKLQDYLTTAISIASQFKIQYKITDDMLRDNRQLLNDEVLRIKSNFTIEYISTDNVLKECREITVDLLNKLEEIVQQTGFNKSEIEYEIANLKSKLGGLILKW